jgi:hypothetical protein
MEKETKETTAFEDLINLYTQTKNNSIQSDKILNKMLEEKQFTNIEVIDTEYRCSEKFSKELKILLQKHFRTHIEIEIPKLEKEYEKEHDSAVSAWNSYGSELAGDFNSGEVNAKKKLDLFKSLLK